MINTSNHISFFGLMRSGNHAILHFIYRQYNKPKAFLNNRDLYGNVKIGKSKWDVVSKGYNKKTNRELMLISYEDKDISLIDYDRIVANRESLIGRTEHNINILCIRDPFNTFASRMTYKWTNGSIDSPKIVNLEMMPTMWKVYAKECLGITNNVPNKIVANFNSWLLSRAFRKKLSKELGQPFISKNWRLVTKEGGGSSWNEKGKNSSRRRLLRRWKHLKNDSLFRSFFKDDELWDLYEKLFDKIGEVKELRE